MDSIKSSNCVFVYFVFYHISINIKFRLLSSLFLLYWDSILSQQIINKIMPLGDQQVMFDAKETYSIGFM